MKKGIAITAFKCKKCGKPLRWELVREYSMPLATGKRIRLDGAMIDEFKLPHGYWEAKDSTDDLPREVRKKFESVWSTFRLMPLKRTTLKSRSSTQMRPVKPSAVFSTLKFLAMPCL